MAEMKDAVMLTGGLTVQTDTFHNVVFRDSLKRLFARDGEDGFLALSSNATFEVIPSRDIKVRWHGTLGFSVEHRELVGKRLDGDWAHV